MSLLGLVASTAAISVSGALSPGPVTAVTIGYGTRDRHAGARVALGHAMIEGPFIALLAIGFGELLRNTALSTAIAFIGGACLLWMGVSMLRSARQSNAMGAGTARDRGPVSAGFLLSATNPYFYLWWLSVGLALLLQARAIGTIALAAFTGVHWLCDLVWLWLLSAASSKGGELFGTKFHTVAFVVCGLALTGFGIEFVYSGITALVS